MQAAEFNSTRMVPEMSNHTYQKGVSTSLTLINTHQNASSEQLMYL